MKPGFFYINCRWSEAVNHRHAIDAGLRIRDTANRTILVFVADVVGLRYQRLAKLVVKTERQFVALDVGFVTLGLAVLRLQLERRDRITGRSEERRVGKECVRKCRYWGWA